MKHRVLSLCAVRSYIFPVLTGVEAQSIPAVLAAFPDFLPVRAEFLSSVITATPARALAFKPTYRDTPRRADPRIGREGRGLVLRDVPSGARRRRIRYGSRGNVIIKRDATTGYVTHVLWYLSDDGMSWISLTPKNERTLVDYVVAGSLVTRRVYRLPALSTIFSPTPSCYLYDVTRVGLDWSLVFGGPRREAGGSQQAVATLAEELSSNSVSGAAGELLRAARPISPRSAVIWPCREPQEARRSKRPRRRSPSCSRRPTTDRRSWPRRRRGSVDRGLPLEAAAAIVVGGIADSSVYIAFVERHPGHGPRQAGDRSVPKRAGVVRDPRRRRRSRGRRSRLRGSSSASRHGAMLRLFRLPLPAAARL